MSEKNPEEGNIYHRVASGITTFMAFCCIVNGVYGYGWTQHVIIKHHGDQSRDVIVVEEGIWLARACDIKGDNCYMSTKQSLIKYAGMSASKAVFGEIHKVLSTVAVIASTLCVMFTVHGVVVKDSNSKRRIRSLVIAAGTSLVTDVSLLCLFCTVPTAIVSRFASSWALIVTFVGCCLEFLATLLVFHYVINLLRHHWHHHGVRSVPRSRILPVISYGSNVITPPDYATLYPDFNQHSDNVNVSCISTQTVRNDNKRIPQNKTMDKIKLENMLSINTVLAI